MNASTTGDKRTASALLKVVSELTAIDPKMQVVTVETLLRVYLAGDSGAHRTELIKRLPITPASVTRNIGLLSKVNYQGSMALGLVDSREDYMNRRYNIDTITKKGKLFVEKLTGMLRAR